MDEITVIHAHTVEIKKFEDENYSRIMELIKEFITKEDLYDVDIIGMHCEFAQGKWYASLIYRGEAIEDDKDGDELDLSSKKDVTVQTINLIHAN